MKQYRLLRNNKESGPYSAEELIQLGFKPYDLIWADGKSAAWRYPGEIEEFKLYAPEVEEQPFDRFYKKPSAVNEAKKETPVTTTTTSINAIPSVAVKPEKPRIRIKADSRKIETPVASKPVTQKETASPAFKEETVKPAIQKEMAKAAQTTATNPDWKDMWLNWEQEKKAVSAANNIPLKEQPKEALETKFVQSLDEIKERYAETVLKPRKNSPVSKSGNFITVLVLIIAIAGFAMWMGFKWSGKSNAITEQKVVNPQPQPDKSVAKNEEATEQILPANNETEPANNKTKDVSTVPVSATTSDKHVVQTSKIPASKKSQILSNTDKSRKENPSLVVLPKEKKPVKDFAHQIKPNDIPLVNNNAAENEIAENKNIAPPRKQEHQPGYTHFKQQPKITDFIAVDTYAPSTASAVGVKLRVQNISDVPVDMAMIDLQYYDAAGRYQTGATIYVRNIGAGQIVTVPAPDNSHAVKVNYRISMVSSESNNLYLIAD